ncbi:hypothetical protein Cni_G06908 [Canna indica]|uniref:Uncharacterized protein n=1 Tax=Canna indica TaxID=4628 RepID=A0AAQ3Q583_9LILI|nr:hypothetical protein Cni_G06908 [Canna indica]
MAEGCDGGRPSMVVEEEGIRKGWMGIRVGARGEEQRRFVVPVEYLRHPLFVGLLKEAEEEYGFHHQGPIFIPCRVDYFYRICSIIERERRRAVVAGGNPHHFRLGFTGIS